MWANTEIVWIDIIYDFCDQLLIDTDNFRDFIRRD
jgi:hypothetical protein